MVYPATNSNEAVELVIDAANQMHQVINGAGNETVQTESGDIPSVRKAIADSLVFLEPVPWTQGESETNFLQIRSFNNDLYWAPSATVDSPKPMGTTPVGDSNWKLAPLRLDKSSVLSALGYTNKGFWDEDPKLEDITDFVVERNTGDVFGAITLPYQVDSATNPNPNELLPDPSTGYAGEVVDVSKFIDDYSFEEAIKNIENRVVTGGSSERALNDILSEKGITAKDLGAASNFTDDDTVSIQSFETITKPETNSLVTVDPETINSKNFDDTILKYGNVKNFSQHFFNESVSKISNGELYTAWAQDSAYVLNNQTRVWVSQKWSHTDYNSIPVCLYSDDDDATFSTFILDETLTTHSVWSAGIANGREFIIIRDDSKAPAYTYQVWKRNIPTGEDATYFDGWAIRDLTIPPCPISGATSPHTTMIHSFTEGADGRIVVCAHNGDGAWLLYSDDDMVTMNAVVLLAGSNQEEATIKYKDGIYYGFTRAGNDGNNPKYWYATDINNPTFFTAPQGTFGVNALSDCPVPFQIDENGIVHAFVAYRNGTLEGRDSDKNASMFYITGVATQGNFWATADVYQLGVAYHAELGGASAIGVGSVVIHNDKVNIYGGSEGRTGRSGTRDRVADIFQFSFPLKKSWGAWDHRQRIARNGVAPYHYKKLRGENAYAKSMKFSLQYREVPSVAYTANRDRIILEVDNHVDCANSSGGYGVSTTATYAYYYGFGTQEETPRGLRINVNSTNSDIGVMGPSGEEFKLWDGTNKRLRGVSDNSYDFGGPSQRAREVYCVNPNNNTSDKTRKTDFEPLDDSMIEPLMQIARSIQEWKWIDSVNEKGELARIHVGPLAQEVYDIIATVKSDPFRYSFLCKDLMTIDVDVPVVISQEKDGNDITEVVSKEVPLLDENGVQKEIWGLRHAELQYAISWAQQKTIDKLLGIK